VDLIEKDFVEREMILVKVTATSGTREEILRVVDIFRGKVIDVGAKTYTIEVTGTKRRSMPSSPYSSLSASKNWSGRAVWP